MIFNSLANNVSCDNVTDVSADGNVTKQWPESREINTVSVKPDKFQKLRRIAASCTEKIQNPKSDDFVISSVGSSPASSPRPENMTALSTPVDPSELHARLTVLVLEEDKENCELKSGGENLQAGGGIGKGLMNAESDVKGDTMDKNANVSVSAEEFYAVSGDIFAQEYSVLRVGRKIVYYQV